MSDSKTYLLIYDGECRFCRASRDWLMSHAQPGVFEPMACQDPALKDRAPRLSPAQCMEAMQLVAPGGEVYSGAAALPVILRFIPRYRWLASLLALPLVHHAAPLVYRLIARNRSAISAWLPPERGGEKCTPGGSCKL